ncbi:MAG: glycosyltransferase [Ilumatobacter sp.]
MNSTLPALLDVRWLATPGGVGSVARHILDGLHELDAPPFELLLWGDPERIGPHPDWCRVHASSHIGNEHRGQRELFSIPEHCGGLYLQQVRPLRDWRSATIIHDTIQVRSASVPVRQRFRIAFLTRVARRSQVVLTVSEHSRRTIERDLGRPQADTLRVWLPMDVQLAQAVRARRSELVAAQPQWRPTTMLFVGRMDPNKNLLGLFEAVGAAKREQPVEIPLHIFGARPHERDEVLAQAHAAGVTNIDVAFDTSQNALVDAYARARVVVLPSFEEGWGLPAWEAIACGIPVIASDAGSLPELVPSAVSSFRLVNVSPERDELRDAIVELASTPLPHPATMDQHSIDALDDAPTAAALAADVLDAIARTRSAPERSPITHGRGETL